MILEQGTTMSKSRKLMLLGTTAMIASFGFAPMAYAQNADGTEVAEDEIVITGIRQSLTEMVVISHLQKAAETLSVV